MLSSLQVARKTDIGFPATSSEVGQECQLHVATIYARPHFRAFQSGASALKPTTQTFRRITVEDARAIQTVLDTLDAGSGNWRVIGRLK